MGFGWVWLGGLSARTRAWLDRMVWLTARGAVDAVRYQPRHLDLVVAACGTSQPGMSPSVARWLVETRAQPAVVHVSRLPHAMVRTLARQAARWFGPTASAVVRFFSGALAAAADHAGSLPVERRLVARVHPGLLVPHLHVVAVLAVDMRGFSKLTGALEDTQNLAAFLGSEAGPGTSLVDCGSFRRAGAPPPPGKVVRLRSRKRRQRVETVRLYHGGAGIRGA